MGHVAIVYVRRVFGCGSRISGGWVADSGVWLGPKSRCSRLFGLRLGNGYFRRMLKERIVRVYYDLPRARATGGPFEMGLLPSTSAELRERKARVGVKNVPNGTALAYASSTVTPSFVISIEP